MVKEILMWKSAVFLLDIMLSTPDLNLGQFVPNIIFSTICSIEFVGHGQHFVWGNECCSSKISLLTTNNPEDDAHVGELPWLGLILSLGEALVCPREGQIPRGIPPALAVILIIHRPSVNILTLLDSEVWLL